MSFSVLAFDFGASSGRAIKAVYENGNLSFEEIHRFENNPIEHNGKLCWDFNTLMAEIHTGIEKAGSFDSIGFDTWGVDYGLLDNNGKLTALPVHYRDSRTENTVKNALDKMSAQELYAETGNQIMSINTLFQLLSEDIAALEKAESLLFMPDLFAYMLCGKAVCEASIASTSQMLNPASGIWSTKVLDGFKINQKLFAPLVKSGTVIGEYNGAKVISVAGHDTQCAVAALPSSEENIAFLSCGTWSLLGTELSAPVLTEESLRKELSNEIGANGKINYLKNIIGLWLIQESRREWRRKGKEYSYADLERLALAAKPLKCFINPDASEFTPRGDIPARVMEFCRKTNQPVPQTTGEIMRCIYESLALKYSYAVNQLQAITGKRFTALHILGGGTKDSLLCQMTADSTGLPVVAGPTEATALGNIIIQLTALRALPDINAGRALIAKTEVLKYYTPSDSELWSKANQAYFKLITEV